MKRNELRVNVFVYDSLYKKIIRITDYDAWRIYEDYNYFNPIPLTEEWLEKFGLKLNKNHTCFHIKGMQFEIPSMIGGFYDNEYGFDEESKIELKYVHQLQNLYFALTGEEL